MALGDGGARARPGKIPADPEGTGLADADPGLGVAMANLIREGRMSLQSQVGLRGVDPGGVALGCLECHTFSSPQSLEVSNMLGRCVTSPCYRGRMEVRRKR
jgi:hypothetical protein